MCRSISHAMDLHRSPTKPWNTLCVNTMPMRPSSNTTRGVKKNNANRKRTSTMRAQSSRRISHRCSRETTHEILDRLQVVRLAKDSGNPKVSDSHCQMLHRIKIIMCKLSRGNHHKPRALRICIRVRARNPICPDTNPQVARPGLVPGPEEPDAPIAPLCDSMCSTLSSSRCQNWRPGSSMPSAPILTHSRAQPGVVFPQRPRLPMRRLILPKSTQDVDLDSPTP